MSISFTELKLRHFDPDTLLYAIISSTKMEQRILAGGSTDVHLQRLALGDLTITSGYCSFPILAKGGISHGKVHLGLLTAAIDEIRINDQVLPLARLVLFAPGGELHYIARAAAEWNVLELPLERLQAVAIAQQRGELDWPRQGMRYIDLRPKIAERLRREIRGLLRLGRNLATLSGDGLTESLASEGLMELLVQEIAGKPLPSQSKPALTAGKRHALNTMEMCIDRWKANPADGLQLKQITGVSERMLERATREAYGITPHYWLRLARLNAAYRDLLRGSCTSVTGACQRWGFDHMGHFAMNYRAVFGESPRETIRRRAALRT